jgi:steroid 5-alpha reductase family enzyme
MAVLEVVGWSFVLSIGFMSCVWLLSLVLKNASIVDSFWGPGFIVLAASLPLLAGTMTGESLLVGALVLVWGVRLALHVTLRNWRRSEDWRYAKWREEAGTSFWWKSYFKVFLLQAVILVVVALPIQVVAAAQHAVQWTVLDIIGVAIWTVGILFETIGDWQLKRFIQNPDNKGKIMDRGLWRYTRHPNYFGEAILWWGIWLISLSAPWAAAAVIGPMTITFMLLRVSGVRMLEQGMKEQNPAYADYIRRTPPFIPWFPKKA